LPSPSSPPPFQLDGALNPPTDPSSWVAFGGSAGLSVVDGTLAAPAAGMAVLRSAGVLLQRVGAVWRIGQTFAYVLEELAERKEMGGQG